MKTLKKIYNKEYLLLVAIGFLPLMWKILEISFLSSFPNALKILGQIALISIIFKVFEESILNPLFKILSNQNIKSEEEKQTIVNKFLVCYLIATIIFTLLVFTFSKTILKISKVPDYLFLETLEFLKIYIIASGFGIISKYLYTCSLINKDNRKMLIYFLIKSVATTILFICLVPKFLLGLGVKGIAISELMINIIIIILLLNTRFKVSKQKTNINFKECFKLCCFSFAETLIRNVVYYFVILVFLNMLDNQDLYFVSNEFIWSIMLVPTLAQSSLIKQDFASNKNSSLKPYFINCFILISFILILIPIAFIVFKYIYKLENYMGFFVVLLKLLPCYLIFIIDSIIESYFISIGKMHHVLVQTFITNILVYMTSLILYLCGVWTPTLNSIILLFNLGVIISSAYTISVYIFGIKRTKHHA
jgi:hypothetical protein